MSDDLSNWLGKEETRQDVIALAPARRMLATLNDVTTDLSEGSSLPPLWHWLYFLSNAPMQALGRDGHPERGGFLPPVELPYRMFAGGQFTFHLPLLIGKEAQRESKILSINHKEGRSGPLVFVNVCHQVFQDGKLCLQERRDIVYRGVSSSQKVVSPAAIQSELDPRAIVRTITPDPVLLFRFSALTFNGHRIHYDRPYAMTEEGYPGLVVHGPLLAVLLMELIRKHVEGSVQTFIFRGRVPLFDNAPFRIVAIPDGECVALRAEDSNGTTAAEAEVRLNKSEA